MLLAPKPGHHYRRTDTQQLVGAEGFEADPCDLDVIRALECGDLAPPEPKPAKARGGKAKAPEPALEPAPDAASAPASPPQG